MPLYKKGNYKTVDQYCSISKNKYNITNKSIEKNDVLVKKSTNLTWDIKHYNNTSDPSLWGPSFWFTLHNGASKYPQIASEIQRELMKGYILGIPVMLPCQTCKIHAFEYIQKANEDGILDNIVYGRQKLFNWFVDFHNVVNKRHKKKQFSYQEAWDIYNGEAYVKTLTYDNLGSKHNLN